MRSPWGKPSLFSEDFPPVGEASGDDIVIGTCEKNVIEWREDNLTVMMKHATNNWSSLGHGPSSGPTLTRSRLALTDREPRLTVLSDRDEMRFREFLVSQFAIEDGVTVGEKVRIYRGLRCRHLELRGYCKMQRFLSKEVRTGLPRAQGASVETRSGATLSESEPQNAWWRG